MRAFIGAMAIGATLLVSASAAAQAPAQIPVQGFLTDAGGTPLEGDQSITIELFDVDTGGTALYSETQTVMVENGWFTAYVGDVASLDLSIFRDNTTVFAELTIGTETLAPRMQLATVPFAAYAQYAGDAQTVGGLTPSELGSTDWSDITGIPADIADGDDDTDTDTTYTAGTGLSLSGTTFSADASYLQRRVSSTCAAGSSIRAINGDGTVICEVDDDSSTAYSAGTGLTLSGTTFNVDSSYVQRRVSGSCPAGQSIRAISSTGSVTCEVDDTSSPASVGEAALNVQSMGTVSSTTDETVLSRFMGDLGGVTTARVAIVVNGGEGRGEPAGGAGTATVSCGSTTVATISLESGGFRPWTHVTNSFALSGCSSTLDVAVRASSSASPVVIRDLRVLWGE